MNDDDETPCRYAHTGNQAQVAVICGPTRYQLDYEGAQWSVEGGEETSSCQIGSRVFLPCDCFVVWWNA